MLDWLTRQIFSFGGSAVDGIGWLSKEATSIVVNKAVDSTRNRPHPWSTYSPYTSWPGLTDRTYLARHLPPADTPVQPAETDLLALFRRPPGKPGRLSDKSTCLFPAFAQYLTDSFIRTDTTTTFRNRTTSNHEIDLCPLYGRTIAQTNCLRLTSEADGRRGRLKSQHIGDPMEEFPPFLYPNGNRLADPTFKDLDPPLFSPGQPTSVPPAEMPQEKLATIFAVGGDRVNSTPFTMMMNTLLLREHNRIAGEIERRNPTWNDERVFQTARNIMIPIFIKIVIEQYINHITPLPFSVRADPSLAWHADWNRPNWITVEFSLLYRWHSLMPETIEWPTRDIAIKDFTLDNGPLLEVGLDAAFSAAAEQNSGELGAFNTADFLLPIEALAIKQARTNRLDTYNKYRAHFGLSKATTFSDITGNPEVAGLLRSLYGHPDNVEFYPGLFAEDRVRDSPLPTLLMVMVAVDAFSQALTNPLLSEHVFNKETFTEWGFELIGKTSKLGDILARNVPSRGTTPIEMTRAGWRYVSGT